MNTRRIPLPSRFCKRYILGVLSGARFAILALAAAATWCHTAAADPQNWVNENVASLVELYQLLHQAPELSLHEEKTAARLAAELKAAGLDVTTGVGGHGVVGVLQNGRGKTLMIRTDLDALPVVEETGLPYASKIHARDERGATVGVMHACGHDLHIANLIGVARYLASHRGEWSGTLVLVGQPAEELGSGARAMLEDGLFSRFPLPDFAVALHVAADVPCGKIEYLAGYAQANVDSVDITIKGRGGHGASPDTTIDPIVIAARLVLDLQTIISREIKPINPAVITVGSIHGGSKHNIIGDECRLQLTVRSYTPEVRDQLLAAIRRKTSAAAASSAAPEPVIEVSEGTPALYNDPALTDRVVKALRGVIGEMNVDEAKPSMGGEDFSEYGLAGVPICMFRLGVVDQKRLDEFAARKEPPPSLHSPRFYPNAEAGLRVGIQAMIAVAEDLLPPEGKANDAE